MQFIVALAILVAAVFCSYKLANEKGQQCIVWPILTAIVGPAVFIIQYLATIIIKKE